MKVPNWLRPKWKSELEKLLEEIEGNIITTKAHEERALKQHEPVFAEFETGKLCAYTNIARLIMIRLGRDVW